MQFNHDNMTGALLAADLVNAIAAGADEGKIAAALERHEIRGRDELSRHADALRTWADRIRTAFDATTTPTRIVAVNALLTDGARGAYLSDHDGLDPHLHFAPDDDDLASRVRAVTSGGLALFLAEARGSRLGACARTGCRHVFVDLGRNATRRYCSTRCGNGDAVDRHRARRCTDVARGSTVASPRVPQETVPG